MAWRGVAWHGMISTPEGIRAKANKCLRNTFCGRKEVQSYLKEAETTEWARKAARQRENERRCRRVGPR